MVDLRLNISTEQATTARQTFGYNDAHRRHDVKDNHYRDRRIAGAAAVQGRAEVIVCKPQALPDDALRSLSDQLCIRRLSSISWICTKGNESSDPPG